MYQCFPCLLGPALLPVLMDSNCLILSTMVSVLLSDLCTAIINMPISEQEVKLLQTLL